MSINIIHVTLVHQRIDIRIFKKQCVFLSENGIGNVTFLVADGKGDDIVSNVKIFDIGIPSRNRIGRAIIGSIIIWKKLRTLKHDLVHVHDPELLPLLFLIKLTNKIVIYDMHENLPKEILTKTYINKIIRFPLSILIKSLQEQLFKFIPVVFAEKSYPKDFVNVKNSIIVLNYPLINEMNKIVSVKKSRFDIGYIGTITRERGAFMQLQAINELRNEGLEISTTFIGPCSDEVINNEIFKFSVAAGWAVFTGMVKPEIGWKKISECHVGLVILEPSPNFVESYPTKLFEYMVLGIPCIISDFPLYRMIIEKAQCGLLVDSLNLDQIKESIKWMYNNPLEAELMGARGRTCVIKNYSWNSEFLKLKQFYLDLISKSNLS